MYVSICLAALTLWYGIGFIYVTRRNGLDPSLVTYIYPLSFKSFWAERVVLACAFFLSMAESPLAGMLAAFIITFSLAHILLLIIFERTATQPTIFFVITALAACPILLHMPLATIPLVIVQEYTFMRWNKTKSQRYNKWVANQACNIHHLYGKYSRPMTKREWFFVLHFAVTENIARPKFVRIAEYVYFYLKRPPIISTGIMQVAAHRPMRDTESMQRGAEIIQKAVQTLPKDIVEPVEQIKWLARAYNGSSTYSKYLIATYPGTCKAWEDIEPTL